MVGLGVEDGKMASWVIYWNPTGPTANHIVSQGCLNSGFLQPYRVLEFLLARGPVLSKPQPVFAKLHSSETHPLTSAPLNTECLTFKSVGPENWDMIKAMGQGQIERPSLHLVSHRPQRWEVVV